MKNIKHKSLIKFQETDHNGMPLFIYPGQDYDGIIKPNGYKGDNILDQLTKIDNINEKIFFRDVLKYQEKIRDLWQRAEEFESEPLKNKYWATKSFYNLLNEFILKVISYLYYKNLYLSDEQNEQNFDVLFGDYSKGFNFSFDKSFEYAMQLEENIRSHFEKFINEEFPAPNIESAVYNETNEKPTKKKTSKKKSNQKSK